MTGLSSKLKRGDEVIVTAGKDKGKSGKITKVVTATGRVFVEGVNMVKRHVSQREAMRLSVEPGIVTKEAAIDASNVMFKDPKTGKATRLGYRVEKDGSKVRFAKASGETIDVISKGGAK